MEKLNHKFKKPYLVNENDFPLNNETWNDMINFAIFKNPVDQKMIKDLRLNTELVQRILPKIPNFNQCKTIEEKIFLVQNFMNQLEYNFTGMQFFKVNKFKPVVSLMEIAKKIIKNSLPIKCLEAIVLGIYLTSPFENVDRFTIGFVSMFEGIEYKHIVLGIYANQKFGSIGMSRRPNLMYKPLIYQTLYDLLMEFKKCYEEENHLVIINYMSTNIENHSYITDIVNWQFLTINHLKMSEKTIKNQLSSYSNYITHKSIRFQNLNRHILSTENRRRLHKLTRTQ